MLLKNSDCSLFNNPALFLVMKLQCKMKNHSTISS